jgi:integrase
MARVALGYWSDFFDGATVSEVTPARQREFIEWLKARRDPPLSDGYVKRVLTVGKSALNRAYREGEIDAVPFVVPGQDGIAREQILSVAESAALWNAATQPHERMYLALAYGTLARPETILALRREFVDFDRRLLTMNPPGRRQTKKHRPTVPVCDFLLPWLEQAGAGPLVAWRGREIASFKTAWRKMRAAAGLAPETVPKVIRHTMATHLRASGVDAAEIQGMLGHKAYSGKTEVYARYQPDYLSRAAAAIDGYMTALRVSVVLESK